MNRADAARRWALAMTARARITGPHHWHAMTGCRQIPHDKAYLLAPVRFAPEDRDLTEALFVMVAAQPGSPGNVVTTHPQKD